MAGFVSRAVVTGTRAAAAVSACAVRARNGAPYGGGSPRTATHKRVEFRCSISKVTKVYAVSTIIRPFRESVDDTSESAPPGLVRWGGDGMSESLASGRRLIVKIGSALLVDGATGDIRRNWRPRWSRISRVAGRAGRRCCSFRPAPSRSDGATSAWPAVRSSSRKNKRPRRPDKSAWPMLISKRLPATASASRRFC